jgi:hypothetical protein
MNKEAGKAGAQYPPEFERYMESIDSIRKKYDVQLARVTENAGVEQVYLERINKLKSLIEITSRQEAEAAQILTAATNRKKATTLDGQIMDILVMRQKNAQLKKLFTPQQNRILIQNDFFLETPERECMVQDYLNGIKQHVELSKEQGNILKGVIRSYYRMEDMAKLETDAQQADTMKNEAAKFVYLNLTKALDEKQWEQYLLNRSKSAAAKTTAQKIGVLKKHDQYTEEQLSHFDKEIYGFLISENILRLRHKYDEKKLQDGLREMKKFEPASLKKASALEKLGDKMKAYRGTYQW